MEERDQLYDRWEKSAKALAIADEAHTRARKELERCIAVRDFIIGERGEILRRLEEIGVDIASRK